LLDVSTLDFIREIESKFDLVIMDRDGVLNFPSLDSSGYVLSCEMLLVDYRVLELIVFIQSLQKLVVVATNQQCVGKKLLTLTDLGLIHKRINELLVGMGGKELKFYVCPHLVSVRCECRKPNPGMLLAAMKDSKISANRTLFVGDQESDKIAALRAGVSFVSYSQS
jgi:D-glycero-D-manno-heptose 1,7-bisphosphate phosphatase